MYFKKILQRYQYCLLGGSLLLASQAGMAQTFTIPVFPDTQVEVGDKHDMWFSQVNWIGKSKDSLHIPIALHVGDLVNFNNYEHWETASEGFEVLDKERIPYAIAVGNHDASAVGEHSGSAAPGNVNANLRITDKYNGYFPPSRFIAERGRYEEGKSDNACHTFHAGGLNWMVINLEFCPRQGAISWADEVIKKHPTYNVIILTHFYLTPKGDIGQNNAGYGDFSPQFIFDKLIKPNPNVLLVISGHVDTSAHRIDEGVNGNKIYQILQDYQGIDAGGGYLRLLEIDTKAHVISAKMYSPYYNKTLTDSSRFSFDHVSFIGSPAK